MERYNINPYISYDCKDDLVIFYNHFYHSKINLNILALDIFNYCIETKSLNELQQHQSFDETTFELLTSNFLVLKENETSFLSKGFLLDVSIVAGEKIDYFSLDKIENKFVFFGCPSDLAGTKSGTKEGPDLIRRAFEHYDRNIKLAKSKPNKNIYDFETRKVYDVENLNYYDLGNVFFDFSEGTSSFGKRIEKVANTIIETNNIPIMFGGDHSLTFYVVNQFKSKFSKFGIIHFDAHHDIYVNTFSQRNTLTHGNAFAYLLEDKELSKLFQIGLRTVEHLTTYAEKKRDERVSYISAFEVQTKKVEEIFKELDKSIPYYISFDIDCIAPELATSTSTPVLGGLSYYQALTLFNYAITNFNIIGADFVELLDDKNFISAEILAKLVSMLVLNSTKQTTID